MYGSIDVAERGIISGAGEGRKSLHFRGAVGAAGVAAAATGALQNGVDALELLIEGSDFLIDRRDGGGGALGECVDLGADMGEVHVDSCQ